MKQQIKTRYTGALLFECEVPEHQSGMAMCYTLVQARRAGYNLARANLARANLEGAYLGGANLEGANLAGAYLEGANLEGAKFSEDRLLIGKRPFFTIGPIGSRCALVSLWLTNKGPMVKAGCFTGSLDEFAAAVKKTHSKTDHGKEYAAAIQMMEAHVVLWGD